MKFQKFVKDEISASTRNYLFITAVYTWCTLDLDRSGLTYTVPRRAAVALRIESGNQEDLLGELWEKTRGPEHLGRLHTAHPKLGQICASPHFRHLVCTTFGAVIMRWY